MPIVNGAYFNPRQYSYTFYPDMRDHSSKTVTLSGTGATAVSSALAGFMNYVLFRTGTTTTGRASVRTYITILGGGETQVRYGVQVPVLSTVSEEFTFEIGLMDGTASPTRGCYFRYDRLTNTNWLCLTEDSSTETATDSGVAVSTGSVDLRVNVNSDGTSVDFYIDDVLVATNTTNIPSASVYSRGFIQKSAGTTDRQTRVFYEETLIDRGEVLS